MTDYGPIFNRAVMELNHEIGREAAGLIAIGQKPDNAIRIATIRVEKRREIYARKKSEGNVVLLQDHRGKR